MRSTHLFCAGISGFIVVLLTETEHLSAALAFIATVLVLAIILHFTED